MFRVMIDKSDTSKNVTAIVSDLTSDSSTIQLKGTHFMFGFSISSSTIDIFNDETYISLSANMYTKANGSTISKSITFAKCKNSDFPTISTTLLSKLSITSFYCPLSADLSVLGNKFSDSSIYFDLKFKRCSGTDSKGNV